MRHTIYLSLALALFWDLNSGHSSTLMLFLGVCSIALVLYVAHAMDVVDHESQPIQLSLRLPGYLLWLSKEVIISNLIVVKHIWLGNDSISPVLTTIKTTQKTDLGKVIYATAITLTPGTVAVELKGDQITVHSLLQKNIESLKTGEMDRRIGLLEN